MKQNNINEQNNLTATINSFMKGNYTEKQTQDFSCWIDSVIKTEQEVLI